MKTKLRLGFAFVSFFTFFIIGITGYYAFRNHVISESASALNMVTLGKGDLFTESMNHIQFHAKHFLNEPTLQTTTEKFFSTQDQNKKQSVRNELNDVLAHLLIGLSDDILEISILDDAQYVIASTDEHAIDTQVFFDTSDWDFQEPEVNEMRLSNIYFFQKESGGLGVLTPIYSSDTHQQLGTMMVRIHPEEVKYIFSLPKIEPIDLQRNDLSWQTSRIYLLDPLQRVVYSSGIGNWKDTTPPRAVSIDCTQLSQSIFTDEFGQKVLRKDLCLANKWIIRVETDFDSIIADLNQHRQFIFALGIIAFFFLGWLAQFPILAFIHPLEDLTRSVKRVEEGNFTTHLTVRTEDEMGEIGKAFNAMVERLHASELRKQDFISIVSHQFRSPLTAMRLYIDMLMKQPIGTQNESVEYLQNIKYSIDKIGRLLNELLNLSYIESGHLKLDLVPTDPMVLLEEVIREVQPNATLKSCTIHFIHTQKAPSLIPLDQALFRHVFTNVLENAIKYSNSRTNDITVTLTYEQDMAVPFMRIAVQDHGIGISPDDQPHVYEKFFRGENATDAATEGTGLGLYVAKTVLDQTGGRIWFESTLGKGTIFYLEIPLTGMSALEIYEKKDSFDRG